MRNFFKGLDMSFYGFNGTLFLKPHQEHCPPYESAAQYGGTSSGIAPLGNRVGRCES
ncbi:hypothetical protein UF75_4078 [Desulfosporosinus sp. I2]|nr:hypothetical protein UF75_4078 [Desulfosporosinus sp. I2]